MALLLTAVLVLPTLASWNWVTLALIPLPLLVGLIWIVPWLVYSLCRVPVLDNLWEGWPPFLDRWFEGIPQFGPGSANPKGLHVMGAYLPPLVAKWDSVYWSPSGSPQQTLLRAGIRDLYRDIGEPVSLFWHECAFILWWLWHWCAPVWGGYVMLLTLLTPTLWLPVRCLPYTELQLIGCAWLWMVYGFFYVLRESAQLSLWGRLDPEHLRLMPPPLHWKLKDISVMAGKMTSGAVTAVLGLIQLLGTGAYLSIVKIVFAKG